MATVLNRSTEAFYVRFVPEAGRRGILFDVPPLAGAVALQAAGDAWSGDVTVLTRSCEVVSTMRLDNVGYAVLEIREDGSLDRLDPRDDGARSVTTGFDRASGVCGSRPSASPAAT